MANALHVPRLARTEAEPLLATIGNTPLLRLEKVAREFPDIEIFGKAEYFNPGGSVKDRAALSMVLDGERSGKLNHHRTILDSTSGNTGIAYAMIGANRGYKVKLVLPGNASEERKRILKAYGAEMVFSDPNESSDGAIRLVRQIYMADPDRYFYPDQYNNPANWKAHFEGTGAEIIHHTSGAPGTRRRSHQPGAWYGPRQHRDPDRGCRRPSRLGGGIAYLGNRHGPRGIGGPRQQRPARRSFRAGGPPYSVSRPHFGAGSDAGGIRTRPCDGS